MYIRCANVVLVNEEFRLQCTAGMVAKYRMKRLGFEIRSQIPALAYICMKLYNIYDFNKTGSEIRKRKANWIGHILRRNCLLQQVIEGKIKRQIEVTRRRKKLLDDLKDRRGYYQLKVTLTWFGRYLFFPSKYNAEI